MVFIGGRNITFRSFNQLDDKFRQDYEKNTTSLCTLKAADPNVNADAEMVIGITDKTVLKTFFQNIVNYNKLKVFKTLKLRWFSATGSSVKKIEKDSNGEFKLDAISLMNEIIIKSTNVDQLIDYALSDFDNLKKTTNFKRGLIMVFTDKTLKKERNATKEFDHRGGYYIYNDLEMFNPANSVNVTVFMNILNYAKDATFSSIALSHVSLGGHFFEAYESTTFINNVNNMLYSIEANLTERCNTETCNGFCDGKNRCTCPMCCENDCYYTYCDTKTGTCTPWPKANPKMKIDCKSTDPCGNTYECLDGYGCIVKDYAPGCEPESKCNVTVCDPQKKVCLFKDTCTRDTVPYNGKCYNYKCEKGQCVRSGSYADCPVNNDPCKELVCGETTCEALPKKCVKTAPYTDMDCYEAVCEEGQCKNVLTCEKYNTCGGNAQSTCYCNAQSDYKCKCNEPSDKTHLCENSKGVYCNYTGTEPTCYNSCVDKNPKKACCNRNLYIKNCLIDVCDTKTGTYSQKNYPCESKLQEIDVECRDYFDAVCEGDKTCVIRMKNGDRSGSVKIPGCRYCVLDPNGFVTLTDDECPDKPASSTGAPMKCVCDEKTGECGCEYEEIDCKAYFESIDEPGECPQEETWYTYEFDPTYGECYKKEKQGVTPKPCTKCQGGERIPTCKDLKIEREFKFEIANAIEADGLHYKKQNYTIKYSINKICLTDHCIPAPRECADKESGNCVPKGTEGIEVFSDEKCMEILKEYGLKDCNMEAKYIYPEFFSYVSVVNGQPQEPAFYSTVESVARCEFTIKRKACGACLVTENIGNNKGNGKDHQICEEDKKTKINGIEYKCNAKLDECEPQPVDCPTDDKYLDKCLVLIKEEYECRKGDKESDYINVCKDNEEKINEMKKASDINKDQFMCMRTNCTHIEGTQVVSCPIVPDDLLCDYAKLQEQNPNHKFGCLVPSGVCDGSTTQCSFVKLTSIFDSREIDKYRIDENGNPIDISDKCVRYECVDSSKYGHYYKFTKNLHDEIKPKHKCENRYCDPATGKEVEVPKLCDVTSDFPHLPPAAVLCNRCECNYKDGKMTLLVNANTTTEKYYFDACGNCNISYYDENGTQIGYEDFGAECVLNEDVNTDGVIAGAVTVGVVVVAVTCSLVVVGIGALQTFQLVSSAMKNTVGTMNENPNFEAADKAATNSNFAG